MLKKSLKRFLKPSEILLSGLKTHGSLLHRAGATTVAELFLVFFLDFNAGVKIHSFLEDYRLIAS